MPIYKFFFFFFFFFLNSTCLLYVYSFKGVLGFVNIVVFL